MRKAGILALINAVASVLNNIYLLFSGNRFENLSRLQRTPQVQSMEHLLNEMFDRELRRIYITDGDYQTQTLLYKKEEQRDIFLYTPGEVATGGGENLMLYQDSELGFINEAFVVHIPDILSAQESVVRAVVDKYKLVGRFFKIETF
jgi:hypothetical protein